MKHTLKGIAVVLFLAVLISGCQTEDEKAIKEAKEYVARAHKDPEFAKFRDARIYRGKSEERSNYKRWKVCGYVNGKNSYGGYTGEKRFVVYGAKDITKSEPTSLYAMYEEELGKGEIGRVLFNSFWDANCREES